MVFFDFFMKIFRRNKKHGKANQLEPMNSPISIQENNRLEAYKNVTQIDATNGTDIISFRKISIGEIQKYDYQEITPDRIKSGLSNIVSAGTQIAAISVLNPTGLFTATVSPQLLTLFADGTVSTMIHQGGRIVAHAGFRSVSATVFAPIAVMQLLSMITGQYYMNGITKQLKSIDKKITLLIKFHHTEKIAKLENAHSLLKELFEIKTPGIEHLIQLKMIEHDVGAIYREYKRYLEGMDYAYLKDEDLKLSSVNDMENLFNVQNESGLSFYLYMTVTADEILRLVPIIEFALNVKINSRTRDRNSQINELFEKIDKIKKEDFFAYSIGKDILEKYFAPFLSKAERIKNSSFFHEDDMENKVNTLKEKKEELVNEVLNSGITYEIKNKIVEQMAQPIDILYSINEDGKELVYIKQ
jgi:hypothetical protein